MSKTVKAVVGLALWLIFGSIFVILEVESHNIKGLYVVILLILMGLLAGFLKEHSHETLFPKGQKKHQ